MGKLSTLFSALKHEMWYEDAENTNPSGLMFKLREQEWDQEQFNRIYEILKEIRLELGESEEIENALALGGQINELTDAIALYAFDMNDNDQDAALDAKDKIGILLQKQKK